MKIERMQYHDALYSQGNARKVTKKKGREESYSVDPESDKQKQHSEQKQQEQLESKDETAESVVAQKAKDSSGALNIVV